MCRGVERVGCRGAWRCVAALHACARGEVVGLGGGQRPWRVLLLVLLVRLLVRLVVVLGLMVVLGLRGVQSLELVARPPRVAEVGR